MDFKKRMQKFSDTIMNSWKTGKIQRTGRIFYGVVWNIILFILIVGFLGFIFVGGVGAGYFASLVKDEEIRDFETLAQDIYNYSETSRMYFADEVFLGEINSDLHRDETTLDKIAPHLLEAVIATEDEYFLEHHGIVPKAILRAIIQEVTNAPIQTGGSTLTQQLIKNQILTNEVSFERKAKEILLAMRLERFFEKDEILEAYLNIVPYGRDSSGRNIAGIQTAAQGIFGIDASEVNLAQAAYLAGLPQSPSYYTPFKNGGGLKSKEGIEPGLNRMKTVLNRMYEMKFITKEEYDEALNYDIVADFKEEEEKVFEEYPVLANEVQRRAIDIITKLLLEENGITEEDLKTNKDILSDYQNRAKGALQNNGYEIHTTIDKELYDLFQEIGKNFKEYGSNKFTMVNGKRIEQEVQGAAIMIENSTGRIISFFGNRNPSIDHHWNFATQTRRQNGSTMKPILVYGPAMEEGYVQPGTPIPDVFYEVKSGSEMYRPRNVDRRFHGILPARTNLVHSHNVPAVRVYHSLIPLNPVDKYLKKLGFTTVKDNEYAHASLGIGALEIGVSLEENANAFSAIANGGVFEDAYMIEKITTKDGEVIYEHEPNPVEVFSPQTSFLLIDMMRDVINQGTASRLRGMLKYPHVDWAGKTGTTNKTYDVQFVGVNPNITFATWMGYDQPDSLEHNRHYIRNLTFWAEFINAASDLRPELVVPNHAFQQPDGIVRASYCAISGKLPSELCEKAGLVKSDYFNAKFVPSERDNSLITGAQVIVDGKAVVAGPNTPSEFVQGDGLMFNPEFLKENGFDKLPDITQIIPTNADRSKWEKISFPSENLGSQLEDDGKAPAAPTSVEASGNRLIWNPSKSKDVVGYRIYRADGSKDKFTRVGSTTDTEYQIGNKDGVYHVTAVDYFGLESKPSTVVIVGDPKKDEKEKKNNKNKEEKAKKGKEKKENKEKNNKTKEQRKEEKDETKNQPPDEEDPDEDEEE